MRKNQRRVVTFTKVADLWDLARKLNLKPAKPANVNGPEWCDLFVVTQKNGAKKFFVQ